MFAKRGVLGLLFLICGQHITTAEDMVLHRVRRLINGDSVPNSKPWMAVLAYKNIQGTDARPYLIVCGGVLLDAQHVLITAHCLSPITLGSDADNRNPIREGDPIFIVLGLTENTWGATSNVQEFNVDGTEASVQMHPEFDFSNVFENDIAVITLTTPCTTNNHVSAISLPPSDVEDNKLKKCEFFGWGITGEPASEAVFSPFLRSASLKIVKSDKCTESFLGEIAEDHICADGNAFPCLGDSGSPLMCELNKETVLVGLNSFRQRGSCLLKKPQAFTRISLFLDWIATATQSASSS